MVALLFFGLVAPFSVAWAGYGCALRWLNARPWAHLCVCLLLAGLVGMLIRLNSVATSRFFASRATGGRDQYWEGMVGHSLFAAEMCAALGVGIAVGWRSWTPWLRLIFLGVGVFAVVCVFVVCSAAESGDF